MYKSLNMFEDEKHISILFCRLYIMADADINDKCNVQVSDSYSNDEDINDNCNIQQATDCPNDDENWFIDIPEHSVA